MTRIYALPRPDLEVEWTSEQVELGGIRHRVSLVAARLSRKPERIRWACEALEAELTRLRKLAGQEKEEA